MKILLFNGSNNPNSNTKDILNHISVNLQQKINLKVQIDFLNLYDYELEYCTGCGECFMLGKCYIDDEYEIILDKIIRYDMVIFSTPVYFHSVPGKLKTFIDRTTMYAHILKFAGILSFTITATFSNGGQETSFYLQKFVDNIGTKRLGDFIYQSHFDEYEEFICNVAGTIVKKLNENFTLTSRNLEKIFKTNSNIIPIYNKRNIMINRYEYEYWNFLKKYDFETYQEYINFLKG